MGPRRASLPAPRMGREQRRTRIQNQNISHRRMPNTLDRHILSNETSLTHIAMEIILISFICALSYLLILSKVFSLTFVIRTQVFWDVVFTLGVPVMFLGTFSGLCTAFLAGFFFTLITAFLGLTDPPKKKNTYKL